MVEIDVSVAKEVLKEQKLFFQTHTTKRYEFRIKQLRQLKVSIKKNEQILLEALKRDLGKHENEGFMTEIGSVYKSIDEMIRKLKRYMKPKRVKTPYYMQPAQCFVLSEPYGSVLIIGPFNYPFQLVIEPLIGAIAAGNCAVVKVSELTPNVSKCVREMISEAFPKKYIWCVEGSIPTTTALLSRKFDYIFFTGSPMVGKIVMKAAAEHMTPVTLELGGKSPVIVDETANIKQAARRIVWGKTINVGQTCVAPDYVYVHESVREDLIREMKACTKRYYGEDMHSSDSYGRIVNERHFDRLHRILEEESNNILYGGASSREDRYMELTLIDVKSRKQSSMQEEIFGPILPILTYRDLDQVITEINELPKPLALYLFSNRKEVQRKVLHETTAGGACVNDVISHVVNPFLPFGGVGNSGIGSYHGYDSFVTFSHRKSVFENKGSISNRLSRPPYTKLQLAIVKKVYH